MKSNSILARTVMLSFFTVITCIMLYMAYTIMMKGHIVGSIVFLVLTLLLLLGAYMQLHVGSQKVEL